MAALNEQISVSSYFEETDKEFIRNYQNQTFYPVLNLFKSWTAFGTKPDYQDVYVYGNVTCSCIWNQYVLIIGFTTASIFNSSRVTTNYWEYIASYVFHRIS